MYFIMKILLSYYKNGGGRFYPIELPIIQITECMEKENMSEEAAELTGHFIRHADYIADTGTSYPASEVNYEQSIVAPAADILLKVYSLTKNKKYLDAAMKQLHILELFNGTQPDCHLNSVAIRHWDGFWFGKRKMYGDTFPHYWSALTGNVFYLLSLLTGDDEYAKKAEASFRGIMSMFMSDGTASCAYVYPVTVNEQKAEYYDPYSNDQDWGLYFMLRFSQHLIGS